MGAKTHVSRWGTSLAVRIPKAIVEQWGVQEGSAVEMISRGGEVVLRKQPYDLEAMLAEVTPDNLHAVQDFGKPRGNEAW